MTTPPGPRGREVLGFFNFKSASRSLGFLEQTARRYGPLSYFRLLGHHTYLPDDADLIKEVLVVQQHCFGRSAGAGILRELVGDGLITREEPLHRERRRILQPAFHREQVASYFDIIAGECSRTLDNWRDRRSIDIGIEMRQLTLSIIGGSLFGPEFRESARAISVVLQRVMQRAGRIVPLVTFLKSLIRNYRRAFPHGPSLFFQSERKELDGILQPLIASRRKSNARDVLSLLLNQYDEASGALTDEDIRNEIITFVLAGHETTATALTWACHLLANHPAAQAQLAAEVTSVLPDREPSAQDFPHLTYTSMVFNETLRLYPPVPLFGRRVLQPATLAGYKLPVGATIFLSPYITQRNPRYYPDPDSFIPERWKTETAPKFAWFPFGGGAKMCIGEPLARAEGLAILAAIFRRFELLPVAGETVGINPRVTLTPDRPVILALQTRNAQVTAGVSSR